MKHLLLIAGCVLGLCSCKRNYTCKCTDQLAYEIKDAKRSEAKKECDTHDNMCPDGQQCYVWWNCKLD